MLKGSEVARSEQTRALTLSTIAFTACFAVWTIFSIIGVAIKAELGLSEFQFGLLVATPILTGSVTRLFLGVWTERYGGRLVFSLQMLAAAAATWALTFMCNYFYSSSFKLIFKSGSRVLIIITGNYNSFYIKPPFIKIVNSFK